MDSAGALKVSSPARLSDADAKPTEFGVGGDEQRHNTIHSKTGPIIAV